MGSATNIMGCKVSRKDEKQSLIEVKKGGDYRQDRIPQEESLKGRTVTCHECSTKAGLSLQCPALFFNYPCSRPFLGVGGKSLIPTCWE